VATEQPTDYNHDVDPTPPRGFPPPVPGRVLPRGPMIVTGLAGLLVGALLVGGAWLLFGNDDASSSPIAAPKRLGDYVQQADTKINRTREQGREFGRKRADWDRRSSARLSEAHDGAGAVVQTYSNEDMDSFFALEVFREGAPFPPYVPYSDPKELGLDKPIDEVRMFGAVACVMRNESPDLSYVAACTRSDDELTVQVTRPTGDLGEDPKAVAGLVETAWDELS